MAEKMPDADRLKILFAASEAVPLVKTGGLADVCGALPAALAELGCEMRLLLPAYRSIARDGFHGVSRITVPGLPGSVQLLEGRLPGNNVKTWLVDYPPAFDRDGHPYLDADGEPWPDNAERFALLSRVIIAIATGNAGLDWTPTLLHCHDWQTALAPALLQQHPQRPATMFTIHNLAYQGIFPAGSFTHLGLPPGLWSVDGLEFYGQLSFIKGGLLFADRITTVSPTYALEIQTPEYGCGLDGLLRHRAAALGGILNGIDADTWNPATDRHIASRYDGKHLERKPLNKRALLEEMGLAPDDDALLAGFIGRLVDQKGIDLILDGLARFRDKPVRFVILGSGDRNHEARLREAARNLPHQVAVQIGYNEGLAHRIEAGADLFLMPSRFEPCGLNQMYSLRYGTLPLVRRTGGLADTVTDATTANLARGSANGFVFDEPVVADYAGTLSRALALYKRPEAWRKVMTRAMSADHSWGASAQQYLSSYGEIIGAGRGARG